jgi:hypothetical protein
MEKVKSEVVRFGRRALILGKACQEAQTIRAHSLLLAEKTAEITLTGSFHFHKIIIIKSL